MFLLCFISFYSNECVPSGTCSNTTRVDTRSQDRCCRGFIPRPPQQQSFAYLYYSRYFTPAATQPTGCPLGNFIQAKALYSKDLNYTIFNLLNIIMPNLVNVKLLFLVFYCYNIIVNFIYSH